MATSAFRSTTKRSCQIDNGSSARELDSVPSTPRSKRDPSSSGRGFHRRSSSVTDVSARYLSDCSSTIEYRTSYNKGLKTGCRSVCPSDSEPDMDILSIRGRYDRRSVESEDERPHLAESKTGFMNRMQEGLRRTSSSQDLSQASNKMRQPDPIIDIKDDAESLVKVKTIRAVYGNDPPVQNVGTVDLCDAKRIEAHSAVSNSIHKRNQLPLSKCIESTSEPLGSNVTQAVADIRKEYTTKLEESEKRVRELWSQIAVEERRCLELSKIVRELLPTVSSAPVAENSSNHRQQLRRKNITERQGSSKSLAEEAERFFDECVSISSYDCQGDSDESMQVKHADNLRKEDEPSLNALSTKASGNEEVHWLRVSVGSDGVVLPWLQWESEAGCGGVKSSNQFENRKGLSKKSGRGHVDNFKTGPLKALTAKAAAGPRKPQTATKKVLAGDESQNQGQRTEVLEVKKRRTVSSAMHVTSDNDVNQISSEFLDVDTFLHEKIKYRGRIENGELLLCPSLFLF
ncbi:hypothetical protein KP509_26G066400 [Ceratopteris richardii]|uniref:Uncharacterized protein n=2 Tax=Ceratopteris richardii TaxID=49495 RepID=A0A8T2RLI5_CERRI|nr:hypothetical protein KP509_26G066400 [Ceratopteris richardii]KAH7297352.1 hypothetical protein KP509_26G066400 [Ceratopteris richardii]KAH7297357.1 hypothetical protein KP509_26G066400 [Ceratopteris richardii]